MGAKTTRSGITAHERIKTLREREFSEKTTPSEPVMTKQRDFMVFRKAILAPDESNSIAVEALIRGDKERRIVLMLACGGAPICADMNTKDAQELAESIEEALGHLGTKNKKETR